MTASTRTSAPGEAAQMTIDVAHLAEAWEASAVAYGMAVDGPETAGGYGGALIDCARELRKALATQPAQGVQAAGDAVAWLIVKREFHDEGQGPRDTVGYVLAVAVASSRAESLPYGEYPLYLAAPTVAYRVPLSDEQIATMNREAQDQAIRGLPPAIYLGRAIEAAHGIHGIGAEKTA